MYQIEGESAFSGRVTELIEIYRDPNASAAWLLCDQHEAGAIAYHIVHEDLSATELTYGMLREESERFAAALRSLGVEPGDRVATLMGKGHEYLVTLLGIWRLGAVHVPLFTAFAPSAVEMRLRRSGAKVVVCDGAQQPKLPVTDSHTRHARPIAITTAGEPGEAFSFHMLMANHEAGLAAAALGGNAPVIQIYTSGTTGEPKAVVQPLRAWATSHVYGEFALGLTHDDLYWNAADPGWAYGLFYGIVSALITGTPGLLLTGGFSPEKTIEVLSRFGVTNFTAAPTVYRSLCASGIKVPGDLKLRSASSAGEPLTPEVNLWATSSLGMPIHDHYGQTETGMLINNHHHPLLKMPIRQGSMGRVMPGWSAVILSEHNDDLTEPNQVGRVAMDLANSPLAWFEGYLDDPAKSAEKFSGDARWYLTGDTGKVDEDGYFYFSSRDDDVIIMAGYRIGPSEVEAVISTHPDVVECAIIAVPDAVRGEVVEAFVVLRESTPPSELLVRELQQWVKSRYAAHAYPRSVHFIDALPRTPSGKVQRFVLRQRREAEVASLSIKAAK